MLIGLLAAVGAGIVWRGNTTQIIFGICVALFCGVPIILFGLVSALLAPLRGKAINSELRLPSFGMFIIGCVMLSFVVGNFFQRRDVAEAKAYPAKVAPLLEKYRRQHGVYPTKIEVLSQKPAGPRLTPFIYGTDDDKSYHFRFLAPGQIGFSEWMYESETRSWRFIRD